MRRIICISMVSIGLLASCSKKAENVPVQKNQTTDVKFVKTEAMLRFEKAFDGVGEKLRPEAPNRKHDQAILIEECKNYIIANGGTIAANAKKGMIVKQALDIHLQALKNMTQNQISN